MQSIKNNLIHIWNLSTRGCNRAFSCLPSKKILSEKIKALWTQHEKKLAMFILLLSSASIANSIRELIAMNHEQNESCAHQALEFSLLNPANEKIQNTVHLIAKDFNFTKEEMQDIGIFETPRFSLHKNYVEKNNLKNCKGFSHLPKYRIHFDEEIREWLEESDWRGFGTVAHELGHIRLGHLDGPVDPTADKRQQARAQQEEEFQADLWTQQAKSKKYLKALIYRFRFLCGFLRVPQCECNREPPCPDAETSTHPPFWERIARLEDALNRHPDRDASEDEYIGRNG